jgi:hypothetical protein
LGACNNGSQAILDSCGNVTGFQGCASCSPSYCSAYDYAECGSDPSGLADCTSTGGYLGNGSWGRGRCEDGVTHCSAASASTDCGAPCCIGAGCSVQVCTPYASVGPCIKDCATGTASQAVYDSCGNVQTNQACVNTSTFCPPPTTCSVSTVANGSVSAYPLCQITCNSGYSQTGNSCVPSGPAVTCGACDQTTGRKTCSDGTSQACTLMYAVRSCHPHQYCTAGPLWAGCCSATGGNPQTQTGGTGGCGNPPPNGCNYNSFYGDPAPAAYNAILCTSFIDELAPENGGDYGCTQYTYKYYQ